MVFVMNKATKRIVFLSAVGFLLLVIIGLSIFFALQDPKAVSNDTGVQLLDKAANTGNIYVKDYYEGEMEIPQYDIPLSNYAVDKFKVSDAGVISYEDSALGVIVNGQKKGEVDWAKVKSSGVRFVLLRVGYSNYETGEIYLDPTFGTNIQAALDAGLDVGVYYFSQAVREEEAGLEATAVLDQIKDYQVKYPVMVKWAYANADDMSKVRTKDCTPEQITDVVSTFCQKVKAAGYAAGFYSDKSFGYEKFDLTKLSDYDMWYSEYRTAPAFYYDFKLWEYSEQGTVPGIEDKVEMCISLKKYT